MHQTGSDELAISFAALLRYIRFFVQGSRSESDTIINNDADIGTVLRRQQNHNNPRGSPLLSSGRQWRLPEAHARNSQTQRRDG